MRGGRSLLVLMVVALGLGAYIYFVESERDPAGTEAQEDLFTVESSAITELEVQASSGESTTLRRTDDTWAVVTPVAAPADSAVVDSLLSTLTTAEIDRVLEENPSSLAPFGLEAPRIAIAFKDSNGASHRLLLGSKTPTGSGLYAKKADESRLLLIPAFHETTFDKTTFDLRDRSVLAINRDAVDRLTLAPRTGPAIELARTGADWKLTAPVQARADFSPTDGLVGRLATARMSSIVSEGTEPSSADLRRYGLDRPRFVATIGAGSTTATLAIGGEKDDTAIYARDMARPMVFTVEPSLLTDLEKSPDDLRVKDVFAFNAFSAQSVELTHGATSVAYAKSTPEATDANPAPTATWARTRPDAGEVNQTALTDLLNTLSALRAERFETSTPGSGDDLVIVVRSGSSEAPLEERVTLRKRGSTAHALRDGEPGAAVIPVDEFDRAVSQLNTLTGSK